MKKINKSIIILFVLLLSSCNNNNSDLNSTNNPPNSIIISNNSNSNINDSDFSEMVSDLPSVNGQELYFIIIEDVEVDNIDDDFVTIKNATEFNTLFQENTNNKYNNDFFDNYAILIVKFYSNSGEYENGIILENVSYSDGKCFLRFSVEDNYLDEAFKTNYFMIKMYKKDLDKCDEFEIETFRRNNNEFGTAYY